MSTINTVGDLINALLSFSTSSEIYISGDYDGGGHLRILDADEWVELEGIAS